ncbi:hypothetical protein JZ751_021414 [Albula glossodonta]|uniref:Phosphatase and actin regulator 4 n=1 Tax=Albula glossodonta TaxID=121402 RepID=A0A8T2MTI0_9TELE|nr:hypothetical protein JZ751_021414 [Albula glossodonta]
MSMRRPRQELIEKGVLKEVPESEVGDPHGSKPPYVKNGHTLPVGVVGGRGMDPGHPPSEAEYRVNPTWLPQTEDRRGRGPQEGDRRGGPGARPRPPGEPERKVGIQWQESNGVRFAPEPESLRDTLREPLPPKQAILPPKWLVSSTPEPGSEGPPRNPASTTAPSYSSSSGSSSSSLGSSVINAASKPTRGMTSGPAPPSSSAGPLPSSSATPTPLQVKQPPVPPPKPVNRNSNPALLASTLQRGENMPFPLYWSCWKREGEYDVYLSLPVYLCRRAGAPRSGNAISVATAHGSHASPSPARRQA